MNARGAITVDFIFGLVLVLGFTSLLFAMTFTLSVVEIVQYMTFSASRVYFGAHETPALQRQLALRKFDELRTNRAFAPLFENGWFSLSQPTADDFNDKLADQKDLSSDDQQFTGFRILLTVHVLDLRIPFFGQTFDEPGKIQANVSSFLMREPTTLECKEMNKQRLQKIKQIPNSPYANGAVLDEAYVVITDNGC